MPEAREPAPPDADVVQLLNVAGLTMPDDDLEAVLQLHERFEIPHRLFQNAKPVPETEPATIFSMPDQGERQDAE